MTILISNEKNIRIISLNRPDKLNAINLEMATLLNEEINNAAEEKNVKCLVITGKGRAFSSGGDVDEMGEYLPKAGDLFYKLTEKIHGCFSTLLTMPKPVINSLNGIIAGGAIRSVCEVLGIQDVVAKSLGSANPHNVLKACVNGLKSQNSPKILSAIRGKKISDIVLKRESK